MTAWLMYSNPFIQGKKKTRHEKIGITRQRVGRKHERVERHEGGHTIKDTKQKTRKPSRGAKRSSREELREKMESEKRPVILK